MIRTDNLNIVSFLLTTNRSAMIVHRPEYTNFVIETVVFLPEMLNANRNLTINEWNDYVGDYEYRSVCPDLQTLEQLPFFIYPDSGF